MRISQRLVAVVLFASALLIGTSSHSLAAKGGAITLGSGLAFSILFPDGGDNVTVFSVPEGDRLITASPGLRFGHVSASRGFEFGFDTGLLLISSNGESTHSLVVGLDLQKHFVNQGNWNLFLGGDVGIASTEFFEDYSQPYVGAMIGARNVISDDNGSLKFAVHLRHHFEDEDEFVASFNEVAFALHFDLWIPN